MHPPFLNVFEKKDVPYHQTNVLCLYQKVIRSPHAGVVMRVLSGTVEDNLIFKAGILQSHWTMFMNPYFSLVVLIIDILYAKIRFEYS
jgi:hypothetical protein